MAALATSLLRGDCVLFATRPKPVDAGRIKRYPPPGCGCRHRDGGTAATAEKESLEVTIERAVSITAEPPLAAILHAPALELVHAGVVVCHPHPGLGGDMHYPVVAGVARQVAARGAWALRFDFRHPRGGTATDLDEARADVVLAAGWLRRELGGGAVALAGYSYGAAVCLRAASAVQASALAIVGLPLRFPGLGKVEVAPLAAAGIQVLALAGENDEYGPPEAVGAALQPLGRAARLISVPGANHFYLDQLGEVGSLVADFLVEALRRP